MRFALTITNILLIYVPAFFFPGETATDPLSVSFSEKPEYAVLFVIDGLSHKIWDKMELPVLDNLVKNGTLVERNYLPPAAHPHTGVYAELHTCSIPNPIMMAGTVFINRDTVYLSQCFYPGKTTAFVVNSLSYRSISRFYNYSYQKNGSDAESVKWALEFMKEGSPAFMRVHLQNPGGAGSRSMRAPDDTDWQYNIWAENSPYRDAITRADSLLGEFIKSLDKLGVLDKTVIIVLGDHGQNDSGWHPLEFVDSSITTTVLWGAGIKKGVVIPYAELIDVVPTVCELMEVELPKTSRGRTIVEALSGYGGDIPPRNMFIKEMLDQFVSYRKKMAEARYAVEKITSGKQGFLFTQLNRQISRNFYDINRFTEWPQFDSIEELLENNRETMKKLETLLLEIKNTN